MPLKKHAHDGKWLYLREAQQAKVDGPQEFEYKLCGAHATARWHFLKSGWRAMCNQHNHDFDAVKAKARKKCHSVLEKALNTQSSAHWLVAATVLVFSEVSEMVIVYIPTLTQRSICRARYNPFTINLTFISHCWINKYDLQNMFMLAHEALLASEISISYIMKLTGEVVHRWEITSKNIFGSLHR